MIAPATQCRLTPAQHEAFAEQVSTDGVCILRSHLKTETLVRWREAFMPMLRRHIEREGDRRNRGPGRYYVTLPFAAPWADPSIYADPDILAIVERLVGHDFVFCQLAADTPIKGSEHQELHRDAPPLFPEWDRETPPFQLAVNFPLVDVTLENGPFETTRGTHLLPKDEAMRRIANGDIALEPLTMALGDVMVRDVRAVHRGTPNRTDEPRPMVVLGYSRKWLFRPEVSIRVPRSAWDALPTHERSMLRFNPVVPDGQELAEEEVYQSFAY